MKRLASFLFWSFLFLAVCFGLDQLLVRVDMPQPVLAEVQTFYVDFRTRLLRVGHRLPVLAGEPGKKASPTPPAKVAPAGKPAVATTSPGPAVKPAPKEASPASSTASGNFHYLYVDGQGELHFADSLAEVPAAYRKEAQRMEK